MSNVADEIKTVTLEELLTAIGASGGGEAALTEARKKLIDATPVDQSSLNEANKSIEDLQTQLSILNRIRTAPDFDDKIITAGTVAKNYTPESYLGVTYYRDTGTGVWHQDPMQRTMANTAITDSVKTIQTQLSVLNAGVVSIKAAPVAKADATIRDLQSILLKGTLDATVRAQAIADAKTARDERNEDAKDAAARAGAVAQKGTVATMIVQDPTSQKWYFRQILKDGTFTDTPYNASPADKAKALYNATDGSIGSIGENGAPVWGYRPPQLTKEGEYTYSSEFNPKTQDYTGTKTTISSPGQKLEMYNGQLYITEMKDGKMSVTKVAGMPTMSESDRIRLENDSRNSATAEKNQLLAAAESGVKVDTAQFALDQAKEGKQTAADILAGQLTVIEGLIKSGTAADLAKAQELYQSARRDWEVEKKNATARRDTAQDKGLRRSGMMFLRGATAVQGGKTGADAQKMYAAEYNRTPGKEGETYTERMARSLGLGADLDQNLNTTFPTFTEYSKGVTANVNAAAAAARPVPAAITPPLPASPASLAAPVSKRPVGYGEPIAVPTTVLNDGSGLQPGTALQVGPTGQGSGRGPSTAVTELRTVDHMDGTATTYYSDGIKTRWNIATGQGIADPFVAATAPATPVAFERQPGEGQFQRPPEPQQQQQEQPQQQQQEQTDHDRLAEITQQLNGDEDWNSYYSGRGE